MREEINDTITVSRTTPMGDDHGVFCEKHSLLTLRSNYLRSIAEHRELGFQIVYLNETWVNKNHSTDYMSLPPFGKCNKAAAIP